MATKEDAIQRLIDVGFQQEANELESWRATNGKSWGWDGWIRGAHPHVIATIWPEEQRNNVPPHTGPAGDLPREID